MSCERRESRAAAWRRRRAEAFFPLRATTTAADSMRGARAALKGGNVLIRPAEPSDWEAVRDIRLRSLREEPDAYASDYLTETRFEPDVWKQRLATASSQLTFDDDHALVGIATGLDTGAGDTYVVGMYVAPAARGSGCAHQLLDAIVELAVRRQGKRLVLEVAIPTSVPVVSTARTDSWRPVCGAAWDATPESSRSSTRIRSPGRDTPHTNPDADPSQACCFRA